MLTHWNLLNRLQQAGLEGKDEEDEEMKNARHPE